MNIALILPIYLSIAILTSLHYACAQNLDGDIDVNGPEPIIPHTTIDEPARKSLGDANGCICRELPGKMSVFYGPTCKNFPKNISVTTPIMKFRNTIVEVIRKDDFQMLENLTYFEIESNLLLTKLEPGCFREMHLLANLSMSFNEKLSYLEENVFDGLTSLKEIYLRNNGFRNIIDVTQALSPKYVPNLLSLVLNRNTLKAMDKNDFLPMKGTSLQTLNLVLCQIDKIHPEVLKPLKNLTALRLGENLFNVETISKLLNTTIDFGIPLKILNLFEVGFRGFPPKKLLDIVSRSNITYLNLGRNHFEHIRDNMFPYMPNLETLVLKDTVTVEITEDSFSGMTNLKHLVLSKNKLSSIHSGLLLKTLILLDVSSNSYNTDTHFDVPNNIFKDMSNLKKLQLSHNQVETISKTTFAGLKSLVILELNNAQINFIDHGAFLHLENLKRLNLENNFIGSDMFITPELFEGLGKLEVLLLGGCHIANLSLKESVFKHVPNLYYLGLQRNWIHIISGSQFLAVPKLHTLDLGDNNLPHWEVRMFSGLKLRELNLEQNKLLVITPQMMKDFSYLELIKLEGNPFACDCIWYPTILFLKNVSPNSVITDSSAICVSPEKWHRYSISDYLKFLNVTNDFCILVETSNYALLISFLTTSTILVIIFIIVCYYYRWNLRYWLFLAQKEISRRRKGNRSLQLPKSITNTSFQYDAFVSYSNEDQTFVTKLVDVLENSTPLLKLCVYERDFQIGTVISESVVKNIETSRRIILIISDSFAKSQWCRWEMHLAECHQLQEDFEDGLILIVLEKVSNKYMTPFLKYIIKSRIYLEWENGRKEEDFWFRLKSTLSSGI